MSTPDFPATAAVRALLGPRAPRVGLILGSGLGHFAENLEDAVALPYAEIPGFPQSTAPGHAGRLVCGTLGGVELACFQGRFHLYEGHRPEAIVLPIRVLAQLGVHTLILTNAAGGIREDLQPGTLMLIQDHINALGGHPLTGPNDPRFGPRFPDMSAAYDPGLRLRARAVGRALGLDLPEGVYLATPGPSFETPAEIRAFRAWGADAVGMSTVPECLVARHAGLRVLGISCISNRAAGLSDQPLSQEEVETTAAAVRPQFSALLRALLPQCARL